VKGEWFIRLHLQSPGHDLHLPLRLPKAQISCIAISSRLAGVVRAKPEHWASFWALILSRVFVNCFL
jgi:hypothetical protein